MRVVQKPEAMALLEQFREPFAEHACLPCALIARATEVLDVIADNEHGLVVLNRFAQRRGHLMVWAKRHHEQVHELAWPAYAGVQRLAYDACVALERALSPVRVYSAVLGSTTPLPISYPHLHVHVIPVFESDERARPARVFSWTEGIVVYEDAEASALTTLLRSAWPQAD